MGTSLLGNTTLALATKFMTLNTDLDSVQFVWWIKNVKATHKPFIYQIGAGMLILML